MFCDGHAEKALRKDVVNPANTAWNRRWNNNNQPNSALTAAAPYWTYNAASAAVVDKQ